MKMTAFQHAVYFTLIATMPVTAQFQWTQPEWILSSGVSNYPPYSSSNMFASTPSSEVIFGRFHTYAENPPGPGGPSATATLNFSRTFDILPGDGPLTVTFRMTANGNLVHDSVPGGTYSKFQMAAHLNPTVPNLIYDEVYSYSTIALDRTPNVTLPPGSYTIDGYMYLQSWATSGGPTTTGDVQSTFSLQSVVAEPTSIAVPFIVMSLVILRRLPITYAMS